MLGALALPGAGFAQAEFLFAASDEQRQLIETIEERQAQHGIRSPELIDPLAALGVLYHESGDYALAAGVIERARQIVRINHGLYSLEEVPLIRQAIHTREAVGDAEAAWDLEQELIERTRRHPDDLRTVPILTEIADKRLDILRRYDAGEFPPQIVLGCYYDMRRPDGTRNCNAGSRGRVRRALVSEAQFYRSEAIDVILRSAGYSNDELPGHLIELIRTSYEHGRYASGRKSLRYLYSYRVANAEPSSAQAEALAQIADWDLLFAQSRNDRDAALELYLQAYAYLDTVGVEQASIDRIFAPDSPVVLPRFRPSPLPSDEEGRGYVDVAFDVTRYGESDEIEVLDAAANVTDAATESLVELIDGSTFRPRMTDGRFEDATRVTVRHYLQP